MTQFELPPTWQVFEKTTSTNDTIHASAAAGDPEGTVHIARSQSRGRGRLGRHWWSRPGKGLFMTVLLRPRIQASHCGGISLLMGKAVKDALQPLSSAPLSLYWPNDLYLGRHSEFRKLGGILGELRRKGESYWIASGIGINIDLKDAELPRELKGKAACLTEAGCTERDPALLANKVFTSFWPLYERFQQGASLPCLVGDDLAHVGASVRIKDGTSASWGGHVAGLGRDGQLLVLTEDRGLREVITGDVFYEEI